MPCLFLLPALLYLESNPKMKLYEEDLNLTTETVSSLGNWVNLNSWENDYIYYPNKHISLNSGFIFLFQLCSKQDRAMGSPWDLQHREWREAGLAWWNNRNPSGQENRKTNKHRCTVATTLLMPWTPPPPWILGIAFVLFPLFSIVLRPTRLYALLIFISAKTKSLTRNQNSQESKWVSDKWKINVKHLCLYRRYFHW